MWPSNKWLKCNRSCNSNKHQDWEEDSNLNHSNLRFKIISWVKCSSNSLKCPSQPFSTMGKQPQVTMGVALIHLAHSSRLHPSNSSNLLNSNHLISLEASSLLHPRLLRILKTCLEGSSPLPNQPSRTPQTCSVDSNLLNLQTPKISSTTMAWSTCHLLTRTKVEILQVAHQASHLCMVKIRITVNKNKLNLTT